MAAQITQIECREFTHPFDDITNNPDGYGLIYAPSESEERTLTATRIHTDTGETGEWVGLNHSLLSHLSSYSDYLIGQDPLERGKHWNELKKRLRPLDRVGQGPIDIALWDYAGKHYGAPIHELLGTVRKQLPAYASTLFADDNEGLDSPEAFADFAETCRDMGYKGFKIHGWVDNEVSDVNDISREIDVIHEVGDRIGDDMDLMIDPVCWQSTWTEALKIGKACDEQNFLWYEDPYADGGISQHGHKQLRERVDTPLLQTGEMQLLEQKTDFIANQATDFARASPSLDGGITGAIKVGRVAEGFGIDIEYHITGPAARHCMAATRNTNYYEVGLVHPSVENSTHSIPKVYKSDYSDNLDGISSDGTVPVPDEPGLGVEYDWDFIEANTVQKAIVE